MRTIKSLEKGIAILEVVANSQDGIRVKDIAAAVQGTSNLTLYLDSLANTGFVRQDSATGKYFITRKITEIARKAEITQYSLLKQCAQSEMKQLNMEFDENVLLAVLDNQELYFIFRIQSNRSVQVQLRYDMHYPLHVTAAGKAILAFLDKDIQNRYLDDAFYHCFTEKSLVNPKMLRYQLENIREKGYAVNYGEYEKEIMAVASPIIVADNVMASVVVQFPSFRYKQEILPKFGNRVKQAAYIIGEEYISTTRNK